MSIDQPAADPWHRIIHDVGEQLCEAEPVKFKDRVMELRQRAAAFAAEVEAHRETKNVLDGVRRQLDASVVRLAALETEHGIAHRRLSTAKTMLENHGVTMPEEPRHTGEWYACAVCSLKTDAAPSLTRRQACCGRNAYLGPCCHAAIERSPEHLESIMVGTNHAPGCRGQVAR